MTLLIVTLNVLVDGEACGELDFALCACSRFFPGVVTRKSKETILLLSPPSERNKQRWRMRRCASRLCHNHAHHKRNVEGRNFILLFVRHLSQMLLLLVVKRSTGSGSISNGWNGSCATYGTGVWHALCQWFDSFTAIYPRIIAFAQIRSIVQLNLIM